MSPSSPVDTGYHDTDTVMWVRPNDLDSLGHVNNATVLEYLECGRWDWLARNQPRASGGRVIAVVARMEIDYRRIIESRRVLVHTHLESAPAAGEIGYRVAFVQTLFAAPSETPGVPEIVPGQEAVRALVQVGFYDTHDKCLATVDEFFRQP